MRVRPPALLLTLLVAVVLGAALDARGASSARTITVSNVAGFDAAVKKLRGSGGTIVLRRHAYRRLVIGPRSARPLHIVGRRGARVGDVVFDRTQHVSLGRIALRPMRDDALIEVRASRHVVLHDLLVSAAGTRYSSSIRIPDSRRVTIRTSELTHCGDRSHAFVHCVTLWRWSHDVLIAGNRFHDCRGCDFVHGRFGSDLTIRGNRFDRALPCRRMGRYRCGHNDLVQLFRGRRLRVIRNHFGVYRDGGAQLYITDAVDYATIVNNVFVGTDRRIPGYHSRVAIVVGSKESRRLPFYARVVNNTILTGARRRDGYEGSIRMSSHYGAVRLWKRPIIANNVIALLTKPQYVCSVVQRFVDNLVVRGQPCSPTEAIGPVDLDRHGRPRPDSPVIDSANRHFAPARDSTGRRRSGPPDVGAFEYVRR
jgi:hypothetical protein